MFLVTLNQILFILKAVHVTGPCMKSDVFEFVDSDSSGVGDGQAE